MRVMNWWIKGKWRIIRTESCNNWAEIVQRGKGCKISKKESEARRKEFLLIV